MELRGVHAQERGQGDGNVQKLDKWKVPGQSLGYPPFSAVEVVVVLRRDMRPRRTFSCEVASSKNNILQNNPDVHKLAGQLALLCTLYATTCKLAAVKT